MSSKEDIIKKIKSKGHWLINIHPEIYIGQKVEKRNLKEIIQKATVNLSGWSYPYFLHRVDEPYPTLNGIETCIDSDFRLEFWRITQSANFLQLLAIKEDWIEYSDYDNIWSRGDELKGKKLLGVFNTLFTLTEIFEFAKRLTTQNIFDETVIIDIKLNDLNNRMLFVDSRERVPFSLPQMSHVDNWIWKKPYSATEFLKNSSQYALDAFQDLVFLFSWEQPPIDSLRNEQEKFLQGKI